jgi:hypothetical protein
MFSVGTSYCVCKSFSSNRQILVRRFDDSETSFKSEKDETSFKITMETDVSAVYVCDFVLAVGCIDGCLFFLNLDLINKFPDPAHQLDRNIMFTSIWDLVDESPIRPDVSGSKLVYKLANAVSIILLTKCVLFVSDILGNAILSINSIQTYFESNTTCELKCVSVHMPIQFGIPTIAELLEKKDSAQSFVQTCFGSHTARSGGPLVLVGSDTGKVAWFSAALTQNIDLKTYIANTSASRGCLSLIDVEILPRELIALQGPIRGIFPINLRSLAEDSSICDHVLILDEDGHIYIKGITQSSEGLIIEETYFRLPLQKFRTPIRDWRVTMWGGNFFMSYDGLLYSIPILLDKATSEVSLGDLHLFSHS